MSNFSRVAEIFEQASVAFGRLAQLTLDLKQFQAQQNDGDSKTCGKWSQKEVDDLKAAIGRFGSDLAKVAEAIETKTINQIKQKLKTRAFQDAGLGDIALENEVVDTEIKPKTTTPSVAPVERGRRKQALNQMPEPTDLHPPKKSRPNVDDLNEYTDYSPEVEISEKKSNQSTISNKSFSNENVTSHQNNDDNHNHNNNNNLKQKLIGSTLSSVLSKPLSLTRSDINKTTTTTTTNSVNLLNSGYDANESKYEDYDSNDSDYEVADGVSGRTPGEDYESDEEQEEEEEEADDDDD
ncbi:unnamed protein product [Schistosoma turkestanicum]|nr:unnamed protein product [Schistosoma turkestanicum]